MTEKLSLIYIILVLPNPADFSVVYKTNFVFK